MTFQNEEFNARQVAGSVWSCLISTSLLLCLLLFVNISFSAPWTWIGNMLFQICSFSFISTVAISIFFLVLLINIFKGYMTVSDVVYIKRYNLIERIFTVRIIQFILLCGLLGGCTAFLLSVVLFDQTVSQICTFDDERTLGFVLQEQSICLIVFGIYTGFLLAWKVFIFNLHTISFRNAKDSLFDTIARNVLGNSISSIKMAIKQVIAFFVFYYLLRDVGFLFASFFLIDFKQEPFFGIFNPYQLFYAFVISFYIQFTWLMAFQLLKIYWTKNLPLPLTTLISTDENIQTYLQLPVYGIVKHLVFQQLTELCENCVMTRQEIYSLSELGGHAHLWNLISSRCLAELGLVINNIKEANMELLNRGDIPSSIALQRMALPKHLRIRLHLADLSPMKKGDIVDSLKSRSIGDLVFDFVVSLRCVRFFIADLPLSHTVEVFQETQLVIWICRTFTALLSASYDEDQFGVVQKDLPRILNTLAQLNEAVEKHLKLSGMMGVGCCYSLSPLLDRLYSDPSLPWRVRNTVNQSIRDILNRFGNDMDSVELAPSTRQLLEPFKENTSIASVV